MKKLYTYIYMRRCLTVDLVHYVERGRLVVVERED